MKKRGFAVLMAVLMVIGISGCGGDTSSGSNEAWSSEATERDYIIESGSAATEESSPTEESTIQEDTSSEEDEIDERPMGNEGNDFVDEPYLIDDYSAGIIMCASWLYYNGSQYIIFSLNPDTSEYTEISRLSYWQADGKYYYESPLLSYRGSEFDANFTKVAVTCTVYETEASRAGWVDANGVFFDVAEAVGMRAENDFVAQPNYYSIGFTDDGRFVFAEVVDCEEKIKSENIEKYATFYYVFLDDPSTAYEGNPLAEEATHGKEVFDLTCWINEDEYIASYNGIQTVIRRASDPKYIEEYVSGEVRYNWSGIVGPDGTIAFVSTSKKSRFDMGIYVTQRDGSGLEKIFSCDDIFEYAGNNEANFWMHLISWQ